MGSGGEPKDFDAGEGWNFTTTDRCDLFCNQEPALSVYCDGTSWVGEPEKGIWCYTRPENPGPREGLDQGQEPTEPVSGAEAESSTSTTTPTPTTTTTSTTTTTTTP